MEISLHLGLHKTGSTALQQWLGGATRRATNARYFFDSYIELEHVPSSQWLAKVRRHAARRHLILSCEGALGSMRRAYANLDERLDILAPALWGLDVHVVIFVRPQLAWLESAYAQVLSEGKFVEPERFLDEASASEYIYWGRLVDRVRDALEPSRLSVVPYSPQTVVPDFCDAIDLEVPDGGADIRANRSLSLERSLAVGPLSASLNEDWRDVRFLLQSMVPPVDGLERVSPFSPSTQEEILVAYRSEWEQVGGLARDASDVEVFRKAWFAESSLRPHLYRDPSDVDVRLFGEYLALASQLFASSSVRRRRQIFLLAHDRPHLFAYIKRRLRARS
jgi:hypothetical protein